MITRKLGTASTARCAALTALRSYSEARSVVAWPVERGPLPSPHTPAPTRVRYARKRHEWREFYGHGASAGHQGRLREIPDWEFADGTPAPHNARRHAFEWHKHNLLYQIIEAGAIVEELAAADRLPMVPATKAQRDWDPNVPLFLEDQDERGARPSVYRGEYSAADIPSHLDADLKPRERGDMPPATVESYNPSEFVDDRIVAKKPEPFWNKRLWALSNEFFIQRYRKNTNTLGKSGK
uniref:39S ribosomal protein L52, mitochondrial n=1 Tax=Neobodo designis TaxID=312471 RepID=A0A7S1QJ23_NEODS